VHILRAEGVNVKMGNYQRHRPQTLCPNNIIRTKGNFIDFYRRVQAPGIQVFRLIYLSDEEFEFLKCIWRIMLRSILWTKEKRLYGLIPG